MAEAILISNVTGAPSHVPAVEGSIYHTHIKSTVYDNIRIDATVQISTVAISAAQAINLKIVLAGTTLFTWAVDTLAEIRDINVTLSYIGNHALAGGAEKGGDLDITLVGAGADANTHVTVLNLYVTSVDI